MELGESDGGDVIVATDDAVPHAETDGVAVTDDGAVAVVKRDSVVKPLNDAAPLDVGAAVNDCVLVRDSEELALAHDVTLGIGEGENRDALAAALSVMVPHIDGVGGMMGVIVPESVSVELVEGVPRVVTMVASEVALATTLADADAHVVADELCVGRAVENPDADTVPQLDDNIVRDAQPVVSGDKVETGDGKMERKPELVDDAQKEELSEGCAESVTDTKAVCERDATRDTDTVAHKDAAPDTVVKTDGEAGAVGVGKMVADAAADKVAIADADVVETSDAVTLNVVRVKFVMVAGGDGDATRVASVLLVTDIAGDNVAVAAPDGWPDELGRDEGCAVGVTDTSLLSVADT